MRRYVILLGLAAALGAATAAPAAAQSVSPASYDFGQVAEGRSAPEARFDLIAGAGPLNGTPDVISGDGIQFSVLPGSCDGSLGPGGSCIFRVRFRGLFGGATSAVVGVPGATATVTATVGGSGKGGSGKGKKCKKKGKGKKGAAAAKKKKGCKKKGKK